MSTLDTLNNGETGLSHRTKLNDNFDALNTDKVETSTTVNGEALTGNIILDQDDIGDGTTNKQYSATEQSKLAGIEAGATADQSASEIKTAYESNSNTNAYTDTEKSKLSGIESGAETNNISDINATDLTDGGDSSLHYHSTDRARANHTGTQTASTISDFDTEVSNNTDVVANTTDRHSHTNKTLLDTYTQTEADLADAVSKKHDGVTVTDTDEVDLTLTGQDIKADLKTTTVTPGTYSLSNITVDSKGRITNASSGSPSGTPLTTKGDLLTFDTTDQRLPVGSDTQVLTVDSTEPTGLKWSTPAGGGDVVGPASAVDSNIAAFDTTTGKQIKDGGKTVAEVLDTDNHTNGTTNKVYTATEKTKLSNIALHGVVDPGTILSAGTPTSTFSVVSFDYYINGTKYNYAGVSNQDPGFGAGESYAYIGINAAGLVINVQDGFTPAQIDGGIIEIGIVRSLAGGAGGTLDIITDSPYLLDDLGKRLYLRGKFDGTSYDKTAAKINASSTALQLDNEAGNYEEGNNELKTISAGSNIAASTLYYNGTDYTFGSESPLTVDTAQYNPSTTLEAIPDGKFVTHTMLHSVRTNGFFFVYGRTAYNTYSEALSAEEDLGAVSGQILADVNAVATIVIKKGETTIRGLKDIRHKIGADNLPTLTDGTQNISTTFDGGVREKLAISYVLDTGVIYAEIEKDGGGDLTVQVDGSGYVLDCTTGSGTGGKARVALTVGTSTVIQENWIYINLVSGVATLQSSTTLPSGDVAIVGKTNLLDVARFTADGDEPITSQQYNNGASISGQGLFMRTAERLRREGPKYISGVDPSLAITTNPSAIDTVNLSTTAGIVYQFNTGTFDELINPTFVVVNHPTTPFLEVTSLDDIDVDANNVTLRSNNDRYGLNILGGQNSGSVGDKLYVLLPNGKYSSDSDVLNDVSNYAVTSVSQNLGETLFRIGRVVLKYQTADSGTITNIVGGSDIQDERGFPLGQGGGGSGTGVTTTFSDGTFDIHNSADPTKISKQDASGITTATTRTYTYPDASGTYVLEDNTATLTNKTLDLTSNTLTTTSLQLKTACTDETGSGALVFATSPTLVTPALGTPASGVATNITGLPLTTGVTGILPSANGGTANGFTKFTGPTTAEKTFTLPDASSTLLYNGGALGTPSSGTATNLTGLPLTGLVDDTTTALGVGSIELGHATDTTIARVSAGVISVEGVTVPTISSTDTLTNKTLTDPKITTTINAQTGTTYTFVLTDQSKLVTFTNAAAITATVPPNSSVAFPIGTQIDVSQDGAGKLTLAQGSGVTINSQGGNKALAAQWVGATLIKTATDTWTLYGNLIA